MSDLFVLLISSQDISLNDEVLKEGGGLRDWGVNREGGSMELLQRLINIHDRATTFNAKVSKSYFSS